MFVSWVTDFDCKYETDWWHIIKDEPFDVSALKSNYRYKIVKGLKKFEVKVVNPAEYAEQLYQVQVAAFAAYPKKYRPAVDYEAFVKNCVKWEGMCFAAFLRSDGETTENLCGYCHIVTYEKCVNLMSLKTIPEYERLQVNAAIIAKMLDYFAQDLESGLYIWDGQRSINHETNFQDYLEKYFGFRKAYCKLHIVYRPSIRWIIPILYIFRKMLRKLDNIGLIHSINALLAIEEIKRKCKKYERFS